MQAITQQTLKNHIYGSDIYNNTALLDPDKKNEIVEAAFRLSISSDVSFELYKIVRNNKRCYSIHPFEQALLSRNLSSNIRRTLNKSKSRNQISRQLIQHLKEGTSYRIYRLDIKSFYESVRFSTIKDALSKSQVSNQTKSLIESILRNTKSINNTGLPRGLEFSPSIAELIFQSFDKDMLSHEEVFFYSRYVDDIIVITNGFEDKKEFLSSVKKSLPKELTLNYNKQKVIDVPKRSANLTVVADFEYLGYKYSVSDTEVSGKAKKSIFRHIDVFLSNSRVKKIKTRISRALYNYCKNNDFHLLKNRIEFITSNRLMKDKRLGRVIATGVYYNNVNLTEDCKCLKELDDFLKKQILNKASHRNNKVHHLLSNSQIKELLGLSFERGFRNNNYKRFSPNRLYEIKSAWRY